MSLKIKTMKIHVKPPHLYVCFVLSMLMGSFLSAQAQEQLSRRAKAEKFYNMYEYNNILSMPMPLPKIGTRVL